MSDIADAERKFSMLVAAQIMSAMVAQNKTFSDLDAVMGKSGYVTKRFVTALAEGKTGGMSSIAEIATALGMDIVFRLEKKP